MSVFSDFFSIDNSSIRTYATKENLDKGLQKLGITKEDRPMPVRTSNGRWTAIFPASATGPYLARFSQYGFMTIG
jgi:hypothetical protein